MVLTRSVIDITEKWAPLHLAESWDNPGLQVGSFHERVKGIIISLDITREVLAKSSRYRPALILTHHPLFFHPVKTILSDEFLGQTLQKLLTDKTTVYSAHTNLDNSPYGVSFALAEKLGLYDIEVLKVKQRETMLKIAVFVPSEFTDRLRTAMSAAGAGHIGAYEACSYTLNGTGTYIPTNKSRPYRGESGRLERAREDRLEMILPESKLPEVLQAARDIHPYEEMAYDCFPLINPGRPFGLGSTGILKKDLSLSEFITRVKKSLGIQKVVVSKNSKRRVKKIAVCGGKGEDLAGIALEAGADILVTGDISYHTFLAMAGKITLVDATHRATEMPVLKAWAAQITRSLPNTRNIIHVTQTHDPLMYL